MPDFVSLQLASLNAITLNTEIIVVDDYSPPHSHAIGRQVERYGQHYIRSDQRMGHFKGDANVFIQGLAFARDIDADILIKVSQRLILCDRKAIEVLTAPFADPSVVIALPPTPPESSLLPGGRFYRTLPVLTDVVAIRVKDLGPEEFTNRYRAKFTGETARTSALIEYLFQDLKAHKKTVEVPALASHIDLPRIYLRKSQDRQDAYREFAATLGLSGAYDCREWKEIHGPDYQPRPSIV